MIELLTAINITSNNIVSCGDEIILNSGSEFFMFKIFDCHCDTLTKAMWSNQNLYKNSLHIDIEKLKCFEKAVQIFAIWLDEKYLNNAFDNTLKAIDFYNSQIKEYGEYISRNINENKIGAILSVEGGEAVEGSIDKLALLYDKGVRLMTLTWNYKNEIGNGALSGFDEGLTDFGKSVVREMNRLDMVIDVSHINVKGFWDVYEISEKPFIATHSNSYSVCPHPRNLNDDQLKAVAETNSKVGINLYPPFVDGEKGKIDSVIRHIDHIMNITGDKNIGIGCDFDGITVCPEGIEDVTKLHLIYDRVRKVWGSKTADDIFYNNMYGFFSGKI